MEGECKVMLDATVDTEARKQTARVKPSSKLTTALLVFTLCLAATAAAVLVINRHTKGPGQDEENVDLRHTLRQISNVRAAIHLEGKYNPERKTSVEWKTQVDHFHSQGGLELSDNEIVIPRNGLYFVYSQASFRVNCSSSDTDDSTPNPMVHLSQTVKRWSDSYGNDHGTKYYQTILHSIRTVCQKKASSNPDEENWFSAVYMGAVFNLRRGDKLKTVMKEKMLQSLEDDPGKTFFGVFSL
ncbi:tumor necrosis factor a (TNF superfamily, member 2) [Plectropomus leopardus]|uniref:tumor necrosis factor a (TNF superfamily, member 2) n=1 Tax=Plectropomus leopardus TaxID=160734 RepID=UPI001C4D5AC2|nr:tumor necrosis factor a (TNF superfamily, member 2) [Plectropomus leopardus]